ncbi:MAG TPA: hypothetical protein GX513_02340 [Firmicutes bacterium]|nr:hypothetical protein [Bacillota bacterium]
MAEAAVSKEQLAEEKRYWVEKVRHLRLLPPAKKQPGWGFDIDPDLEYARVEEIYSTLGPNWDWFARTEKVDYSGVRRERKVAERLDQN